MARRNLALALVLFLAACAARPPPPPPTAYVGATEAELVAALGVPSRSYEVDGRRFLAYERPEAGGPVVVPSLGLGVGRVAGGWGSATGFGTGIGLSVGPFGETGPCTTTFELRESRVIAATRQGSGCA